MPGREGWGPGPASTHCHPGTWLCSPTSTVRSSCGHPPMISLSRAISNCLYIEHPPSECYFASVAGAEKPYLKETTGSRQRHLQLKLTCPVTVLQHLSRTKSGHQKAAKQCSALTLAGPPGAGRERLSSRSRGPWKATFRQWDEGHVRGKKKDSYTSYFLCYLWHDTPGIIPGLSGF